MSAHKFDVAAVGNAIVDVLAKADDAFLGANAIPKGGMILIDDQRASDIYAGMAPGVEISGGSAANSTACIASFGGKAAFIGKVGDDPLGEIFRHDIRAIGVSFDTAPLTTGIPTGRCLINVTADAQRSMATALGAAGYVSPDDIDPSVIARSAISLFEGYLFEQPIAREAFIKACELARSAGNKTAITLSDASVVERQYDVLHGFIRDHIDIVFANEKEAKTLFKTGDLDQMVDAARKLAPLTAITRSEKGSILVPRDGAAIHVDAIAPSDLVDTTGAGDAYAAGVLFGVARDLGLEKAGTLGALGASEVISHFGARPSVSLETLAKKKNLL